MKPPTLVRTRRLAASRQVIHDGHEFCTNFGSSGTLFAELVDRTRVGVNMTGWHTRMSLLAVAASLVTAVPAAAATQAQHYAGQLSDGASWVADVPGSWNGTIILYSHGFGPLLAQDAPDQATATALLDNGYALVGSSYSGPSWWALATAVHDQFAALDAVEQLIATPRRTIAWGTSMGGLISALETESSRRRVDATLTTCGLVAGALNLNNYQLDGEYALAHLLAPAQAITLVRYPSQNAAAAAATQLTTVVDAAQADAAGRARIALGAALMNEPTWFSGATPPTSTDYPAQEAQQEQELTAFVLNFVMTGRYQIELAADGNSAYTAGVDYRALLHGSSQAQEVRALYHQAGLDLDADLARLTRDANITPDLPAVAALARTSMPTGRLRVPELDIHTVADQLVPVGQENWYGRLVRAVGSRNLLRQAYVDTTGHCAFQPSETIAALHALESRIVTGRWGDSAEPSSLNAAAAALGEPGRYVRFTPPALTGGLGEPGRD